MLGTRVKVLTFISNPMRKPSLLIVRSALATLGASLCLSSANAQVPESYGYYPTVHETFDNNTLGNLSGQDARGYGLTGKYAAFGAADASAFQVVAGGLPFAPLNSAAGNSLRVSTQTTGTGIGATFDGGKTFGSPYAKFYDTLYTSYLIRFSNITTNAAGRAGVRVNNSATATSGFRFQVSADGGTASSLQPAVTYNDTPLSLGTAGSLQVNVVYMLIGKFTNVGNALAASPADGKGTIYALTLGQYSKFRVATDPQSFLDNMAIGNADTNVTVRFSSTAITTGNFPFGHGRAMQILAQGATGSAQTFDIDEIRYGDMLRSVALPTAVHPTGPAGQAADNFTAGPSEGYPDGGTGWKSNWYEVAENASSPGLYGVADISGTPVANSGSYLQVYTSNAGGADQGIRRRPDPAYVDMSQPYTVKFDFRGDNGFLTREASGGSSAPFDSYNDRIHIGADSDGTAVGTSATMSWLVGVVGNDQSASNPFHIGNWYFYNDDETEDAVAGAFVKGNMTNTTLPLIEAHVYRFVIEVDPPNKKYKATITNLNTNATFAKGNLKFRNQTVPSTTLLFGAVKNNTDPRYFSLDNVALQQGIPDPDDYLDWLTKYPSITLPADKLRNADFDKDGRKNFLEFALDGDPTSPSTNDGKVVLAVRDVSGTNYHTLTIPVRTEASFPTGTGPRVSNEVDQMQYRIEGSYDMIAWDKDVVEMAAPTGLPTLSTTPGYVYKTFRLGASAATQPKGFLRAVIINSQP